MKKQLLITSLLFLISTPVVAKSPNQVYIEGDEIGQGFSVQRLNQCYFIAPDHVVNDSVFLTLKGSDDLRSLGDGQILQPFGYDLAVGHISGSLAKYCGIEFNSLSVNQVDIDKAKTVVVSTVNSDGLVSRIPAVVQETGLVNLNIKALSSEQLFYKGMSGSLIYSNGVPIGMLQSVDQNTGLGKVLRLDRLLETVSPFFSANSKQVLPTETLKNISENIDFSVSYWNLPPTKNELSVKLISDKQKNTYYETKLQKAAEIDLTLKGNMNIKGIKLFMPDNAGIKDVEVLISKKKTGKRGWLSYASNTILPKDTKVVIEMRDVKAHRIKLKVYSSWNDERLIKISEVEVF
ncbi:hypothetical protein [Pseudoalteromonas shioyasakiensis]|uniref:hypothetical protein n=1 Tax=Pseudoalteromonas shioyasakiensis TaxID=1190813 RepID=UPI001C3E6018|nr:hypothetical protein [Pseudoalteromonas shioyasakiensis]